MTTFIFPLPKPGLPREYFADLLEPATYRALVTDYVKRIQAQLEVQALRQGARTIAYHRTPQHRTSQARA